MIRADKRAAVYFLHEQGMSGREIARRCGLHRRSVGRIIARQGAMPAGITRKDRKEVSAEHLRELYTKCEGYIQRVHEMLMEEGITIGYSTLSAKARELELGKDPRDERSSRVADEPGAECQHDTSDYRLLLGTKEVKVIGSMLYYRYSKVRYLRFYRYFNRFTMQCFLHEALNYWGYCPRVCIIDNTSLARIRGSGANAVIAPEMVEFAAQYGFRFACHALGHANRKAGNERSFYTAETNFFPGRNFCSLEDLNAQALEWATKKMALRPVSKTALIPAQAFEHEKSFCTEIPPYVPAPYRPHERKTDQYGFISFDGNFYWVPGTKREMIVVLEYSDSIQLYHKHTQLAQYPLPAQGTKNGQYTLAGYSALRYKPTQRKQESAAEEKRLRTMAVEVDEYVSFVLKQKGIQRHRFLRQLHVIAEKCAAALFVQTMSRALKYQITDIPTIQRICTMLMRNTFYTLPVVALSESVLKRESYQAGCSTEAADLSVYDVPEDNDG
jgi:transposase